MSFGVPIVTFVEMLTKHFGVPIIMGMTPKDVLDYFGGLSATARALGCKPQSVIEWVSAGRVPEGRQYQVELATGGRLRASKPAMRVPANKTV